MLETTKLAKLYHALLYTLDCNLATVEDLSTRAKPPKRELQRQIDIAQAALNTLREIGYTLHDGDRAGKIVNNFNWRVSDWSKSLQSK
jgi:hypothetical protein